MHVHENSLNLNIVLFIYSHHMDSGHMERVVCYNIVNECIKIHRSFHGTFVDTRGENQLKIEM